MSNVYLITGGCGFIGSHLCEAVLARGGRVRILDNLSSGNPRNVEPIRHRVEVVVGDIVDEDVVARAMEGVSFVFHQAALVSVFDSVERPADNHAINVTGTFNVLSAARQCGVRRVVMASTAAVYGNDPEIPKRESMTPSPESPYAVGKITGEYYLRIFHSLYGLETVALRYFNVFGPRQDPGSAYSGVISRFVDILKQGKVPTVYGDGLQSRDFVHVSDVVAANMLAMHDPGVGKGDVFNVGTGRSVTLLDLLTELAGLLGRLVAPEFRPARPGDIRASLASIERIQERLRFVPRVGLRDGLATLLAPAEESSSPANGGVQ